SVAGAAHLAIERLRISDVVGVNSETAQADSAEFFIADGDRVGCSPVLVDLQTSGEKVNVRLEGRLEGLIPVHQVRENGQSIRVQGVEAGSEHVGHTAVIHKDSHL